MRIVFICHEAQRTGVPLLLLELLRWMVSQHKVEPFIILLKGGPLQVEFEKYSKVFIWEFGHPDTSRKDTFKQLVDKIESVIFNRTRRSRLGKKVEAFRPNHVYVNTSAALGFVTANAKVFQGFHKILHCHEMPFTLDRLYPRSKPLNNLLDSFIVVNSVIESDIINRGVDPSRILKVTEYFCRPMPSEIDKLQSSDVFRIVGAGLGSWRKGVDLFVQTAFYFSQMYHGEFRFEWIGKVPQPMYNQLQYEIRMMGLSNNIVLTGEVHDPSSELRDSDVFLLTSREDPYPVVMMEAAWFGKPIVYFQDTGGSSELINDDELSAAPFDVYQMANRLMKLANNQTLAWRKGEELRERVLSHTIDLVGSRIYDFIVEQSKK